MTRAGISAAPVADRNRVRVGIGIEGIPTLSSHDLG
jgi:hypothetical protein